MYYKYFAPKVKKGKSYWCVLTMMVIHFAGGKTLPPYWFSK
jgi:hypothetical protein